MAEVGDVQMACCFPHDPLAAPVVAGDDDAVETPGELREEARGRGAAVPTPNSRC